MNQFRLRDLLQHMAPGPMVSLSRAVAVAMVHGPQSGLDELTTVEPALSAHHRLYAVRAHLLELAGDIAAAQANYLRAAELTLSVPERRYLENRAALLAAN